MSALVQRPYRWLRKCGLLRCLRRPVQRLERHDVMEQLDLPLVVVRLYRACRLSWPLSAALGT